MPGVVVVDPEPIRTRADLRAALERLFHADGRSYLDLATAAGVGNATLHDMVNGKAFPRWDTLQAVLTACDIPDAHLDAWKQAYARARADRPALPELDNRPGRPMELVCDPFDLEVHRAIASASSGLPVLPVYVEREHDRLLGEVVADAAAGASRIAVLVGGSSTGKTRACWEALNPLRLVGDQPQERSWRLWHPIGPTRADAALADLANIGPYTVVWLNEAQFYLADIALGERVAAGLRELLRDPHRAPVLVLATLWPERWTTLTTRTDPDLHAQARELLDGHDIRVPDAFTGADLDALAGHASADPRLGEAAEHAADGQIAQYLAGVPVLLARYIQARSATTALIHAAMDARRLGAGPHLPLALLAGAAPSYLTDAQWQQTGEDWLQHALDYVIQPCNGIPGILVPVKSGTPRNQRTRPVAHHAAARPRSSPGPGALYRLADYLDQHGCRHRVDQIPPIDFWASAATHAHPADLTALGHAAWNRGLYRDSAQLGKHATAHGDLDAAFVLVFRFHGLHPGDHGPASWAAANLPLDDPYAVANLVKALRRAGAHDQLTALLARDPATRISLDNPIAVAELVEALRRAGTRDQLTALAERVSTHMYVNDPFAVAELVELLRRAGTRDQLIALLARDPAHIALDDAYVVAALVTPLKVGAHNRLTALLASDPADIALEDPYLVAELMEALRMAGAHDQLNVLARRLPAAGLFRTFLDIGDHRERFKFGREPDGSPSAPWTWDDLL
ncbi:helix-turn-helix transcriptional regulator [Acrocarpospora sp. B8E8]|uniref:helix-turn-helix transcriptional regulator n=1 Tax=Acrocarpospora sp. B8E8 TaxID=3153572 RepID=UPI00325F911E